MQRAYNTLWLCQSASISDAEDEMADAPDEAEDVEFETEEVFEPEEVQEETIVELE